MIIYCYRSGQVGFALRKAPVGAIPLAKGPHPITEEAVHGCARLAHDNETWLVPGIPEATNDEAAYQAMLAFEKRLRDRVQDLKARRQTRMAPYQLRWLQEGRTRTSQERLAECVLEDSRHRLTASAKKISEAAYQSVLALARSQRNLGGRA